MDPRPERALFALVLAAALGLSWEHFRSSAEARRSGGAPLAARLKVAGSGRAASGSENHVLAYSWDRRILTIAYCGRREPNLPELKDLPVLTIQAPPPSDGDAADPPETVKAWILSRPRDLRYWLALPRSLRAARAEIFPSPSWYDAGLVALELYRLRPEAIRPAWLPEPPEDRRLLGILLSSGPGAPPENVPLARRRPPVTVDVLNASGEEGVALQATKVLRWRQADVVAYGNAPAPEARTRIFDRAFDYGAAELVRSALGCGSGAEIVTRAEGGWHGAVTVVLGRDFRRCRALARPAGG